MTHLPIWLSVLVLAGAGFVFLWMAWRATVTGEIRAGSAGLRAYRPRRSESPAAFHFFQLLYVLVGGWLVIYGYLVATGRVPSLPLH